MKKAALHLLAPLIAAVVLLGGATGHAAVPAAKSGSGVSACMKKKGFTKTSPGTKAERRAARRACRKQQTRRKQQARRKSKPRRSAKRSCKGKTAKRKKACSKRRARKR